MFLIAIFVAIIYAVLHFSQTVPQAMALLWMASHVIWVITAIGAIAGNFICIILWFATCWYLYMGWAGGSAWFATFS